MERKQGFFSALKEEVVRGLSPERSRAKSSARSASPMSRLLCRGRKAHYAAPPEPLIARSRSLRPAKALSPLKEGPDGTDREDSRMEGRWGQWMKRGHRSRTPSSLLLCCLQMLGSEALAGCLWCTACPGAR
jgi:hypothetical protein